MTIGDRNRSGEFREHAPGEEGVGEREDDLNDADELRVQRSEEELQAAGTREREAGMLNVRKWVRTDREQVRVPTRREEELRQPGAGQRRGHGAEIGNDEVSVPVVEPKHHSGDPDPAPGGALGKLRLGRSARGYRERATGSGLLASVAQYAIIIYAVFATITELGVAVELTAPTFLIVLGAVALAAALAFGIGGREVAGDILQKTYNRSNEVTNRASAGGDDDRTFTPDR